MKQAIAATISAFICALCVEAGVRLWPSCFGFTHTPEYHMPHVFQPDPLIGWTLKPGASSPHRNIAGDWDVQVNINADGVRSKPFDASRKTVLCVGDSYTFGYGVEDQQAWPALLPPELNAVNAGYAGGMSLDTQFHWLYYNAARFNPRTVIVQICHNDLADIAANVRASENNLHSQVRFRMPGTKTPYTCEPSGMLRHQSLGARLRWFSRTYMVLSLRFGRAPVEGEQVIGYFRHYALNMQLLAESRGFALKFVTAGDSIPERAMVRELKSLGLPVLVLTEREHFPHDEHWTAAAHARVAATIGAWL